MANILFAYYLVDGSAITVQPIQYEFEGQGERDIIIVNLSCLNIDKQKLEIYITNLDLGFSFANGLCTNRQGCCFTPIVIGPACNLSMNLSLLPVNCAEAGLSAIGFGDFPPYLFNWSTGRSETATESSIRIPINGDDKTYTVTMKSLANNCTVTKSILVKDPCPLNCAEHIDNCRTEWQQFMLQNYAKDRCKIWETDCNTTSTIKRNGKVAIGLNLKSVPDGFNLAVQGGVIANEVKIKLCSFDAWCDYVFDKKYKLTPLLEVDKYIQQNKRLPNMPSTADIVKEGGYEIKKLALLQLEKIEEAYLHLIKLEEKVKTEQAKLDIKKQRNNKLSQLLK